MAPPKFHRPSREPGKEWSNADIDALAQRVSNCEDFCEAANDWMHEESEPESEEERLVRDAILGKLTSNLKKEG